MLCCKNFIYITLWPYHYMPWIFFKQEIWWIQQDKHWYQYLPSVNSEDPIRSNRQLKNQGVLREGCNVRFDKETIGGISLWSHCHPKINPINNTVKHRIYIPNPIQKKLLNCYHYNLTTWEWSKFTQQKDNTCPGLGWISTWRTGWKLRCMSNI